MTLYPPPRSYKANIVEKLLVGSPKPEPDFLPQLEILRDKYNADVNRFGLATREKSLLNLPSFKALRGFVAKNLGQFAHESHEKALLEALEPEMLISSAMKKRGVIKKLNLWTTGFLASCAIAAGGVMTENAKVVENGVLGTLVTAVGMMRSYTFKSIGEDAIGKIAKSGGLPRL